MTLDTQDTISFESEPDFESESTAPLPRRKPQPGTYVGRFEILGDIGAGGMGSVHLGYDERLGRKVAVKILNGDGDDGSRRRRMLREARALATVSHPNVVQVYESGVHRGSTYIAMEHVDGPTLREWLVIKSRTVDEICRVFEAAGRGLAEVHARGLVHRDFKPDNVMIGGDGRVRVMDFGLVRKGTSVAGHDLAHDDTRRMNPSMLSADLTKPGVLVGTPAYMAPEQHRAQPTSERTDQFCFCVSLWEALYGQRPFLGANIVELAANVCSGERVSPPEGTQVSAAIRAVVERGLAPEPSQRWPSMDALLTALARARARAGGGRRPRLVRVALAVAGLVVIAALIGSAWMWGLFRASPDVSTREAASSTQNAATGDGSSPASSPHEEPAHTADASPSRVVPPAQVSVFATDSPSPTKTSGETEPRATAQRRAPRDLGEIGDDPTKTAELQIGVQLGTAPATVVVDGRELGQTTARVKLTPGEHTVRWMWADGWTHAEFVTVTGGAPKLVKAVPSVPPADAKADVEFLSNEFLFVFVQVDDQVLVVEPRARTRLAPGQYALSLRESDHDPWQSAGVLVIDGPGRYHVDMVKPSGFELSKKSEPAK